MSENTKAFGKRKSLNKSQESPIMKNTPQQTKFTPKMQNEQKQSAKQNKNKRKSLPANLANGDNDATPKKAKVEPFTGTSDIFGQNKAEPNLTSKNEKIGKQSPTNKTPKKETSDSLSKAQNKRKNAAERKERVRNARLAGKEKLKKTFANAAAGDQEAIDYLKERIAKIEKEDALSTTGKKKYKQLRKALAAAGIELSPSKKFAKKSPIADGKQKGEKVKEQKQVEKTNKNTAQVQKKGKKQNEVTLKVEKDETESEDEEDNTTQPQGKNKKQKKIKMEIQKEEVDSEAEEDEEDSDDDAEEEEAESSDDDNLIEGESIENEGEEEEEDDESDDNDDDEDEEEDSEEGESAMPQIQKKKGKQPQTKASQNQTNDVSSLVNAKSRYVLFVGNLPFDITKEEISQHFAKVGSVKDIRIPLDKQSNKCRGFAYVELTNQAAYEKALSLHHTSVKGRRINVLYTKGGKKKGDETKKEIKQKNFKLQAMRQQGKLDGSVKQSQKRAARREKRRSANKAK